MRKHEGHTLFAASDLDGFLGCRHSTFLDLKDLDKRLICVEDEAQAKLVQDPGHEHTAECLYSLKNPASASSRCRRIGIWRAGWRLQPRS